MTTKKTEARKRPNGETAGSRLSATDPHAWVKGEGITNTGDVPLPELLIDEVIGQEEAVEVAKKAARQRRHLLLLGDPGTGKSMIAKAMAQILPAAHLEDVLCYPNPKDQNIPFTKVYKGGEGRKVAMESQRRARNVGLFFRVFEWVFALGLVAGAVVAFWLMGGGTTGLLLILTALLVSVFFLFAARSIAGRPQKAVPNLLIERPDHAVPAPYVDATGSHAGALLGDIRHDPFQSGGLETPVHLRVEPGAIHRANKGLLFIDEINVLRLDSQQALLTAMQEKKYSITGHSENSAGAMAKTEPVPCEFILVAAGNLDVIAPSDNKYTGLHPALRSRIRGYGYEVYVKSVMDDNDANRRKLTRFIAQEVRRDGQIPHFDAGAVAEVLREAQRRSGHTGKLTLRLRELGGLVRTAGDLARDENRRHVTVADVIDAKRMSQSLEYQVTRRGIEVSTAREAIEMELGEKIGATVGCAFMGTGETGEPAGIVVPIEADSTVASHRQKGTLLVGGGLERDLSLQGNVWSALKRLQGAAMAGLDLHVQALMQQTGADVSALSAGAAIAAISAMERVPVRQDTVIIGELGVSGRFRAVEGVTQMIEGASDLGYPRAIVPAANVNDILLEHTYRNKIEVIPVANLAEAADHIFGGTAQDRARIKGSLDHNPFTPGVKKRAK